MQKWTKEGHAHADGDAVLTAFHVCVENLLPSSRARATAQDHRRGCSACPGRR